MSDTTYPDDADVSRLTDVHNLIGLDASEYDEDLYYYAGTYRITYLKQVLEIVETLGWQEVNIGSIRKTEDQEGSLLLVTPDVHKPWSGEQTSVALAGLENTNYGDSDE